ncbi:MAG: hypothetical protein U1E40_11210 [Amaricoccus sp.]
MAKARASSSERRPAARAGADAPEPKGSINLRIEAHTRRLIDDAAAILG